MYTNLQWSDDTRVQSDGFVASARHTCGTPSSQMLRYAWHWLQGLRVQLEVVQGSAGDRDAE